MAASMLPARSADESPMQPVYPYGGANEPVIVYKGPIYVEGIGKRAGGIELSTRSAPRLRWQIEPREQDYMHGGPNEVALAIWHGDREFVIPAHRASTHDGWINAAQVGRPDERLCRVRLHWMNLPDVDGPIALFEQDAERVKRWWLGRWQVEVDGWRITLDSRPDYSQATTDDQGGRLFMLTHVMEIRRIDHSDFTADRAEQLLEHLRVTFSFAFGHWVAPVLPRGYDASGRVVWEKWTSPICDPYRPVPSAWLWKGRPDDLSDLVRKAIPALSNAKLAGTMRLQMQLAVSAVAGGFVEQRILAASPALENLGWTRLVFNKRWTETEYNNRFAEDRLRYLLQEAKIPTDIDANLFPALAAFAKSEGVDGPSAVNRVRNRLVHPRLPENRLIKHDGLMTDVWRMVRRYVTFLILHDIGYSGSVVDPAKLTGWAGNAHKVPWIAGSALPAMPPDKRTIQSTRRSTRSALGNRRR